MVDLIQAITQVIETQGIGETVWKEKDCVTFIRAAIKAHGIEPQFSLPQGYENIDTELDAIKKTIKQFGSMRIGWFDAIAREPALQEWEKEPRVGMIGMTKEHYTLNNIEGTYGPILAVYGADLKPWARTPTGIAVANPIAHIWRIVT